MKAVGEDDSDFELSLDGAMPDAFGPPLPGEERTPNWETVACSATRSRKVSAALVIHKSGRVEVIAGPARVEVGKTLRADAALRRPPW